MIHTYIPVERENKFRVTPLHHHDGRDIPLQERKPRHHHFDKKKKKAQFKTQTAQQHRCISKDLAPYNGNKEARLTGRFHHQSGYSTS